jgi:DNA replication protein DnaC
MLEQPMIEKLLSVRLQGMADALKAQEQDAAVRELSFVEGLSLLVDQQWNWRGNQALARRLKSARLRHNSCVEDIDYRAARGLEKTVIRGLAKDSQWVQNHENLFVLGRPAWGRTISPAPWLRKRAATDTQLLHTGGRPVPRSCRWHARTEASVTCSRG